MGLSLLSPLPDQNEIVRQLRRENEQLRSQLSEAQEDARQMRQKLTIVEGGASMLRTVLNPLYSALAHIYGELDAMGVNGGTPPSPTGMDPRKAAVWEDWKRKMPGIPARFIDALMLHGELTQTQLRLHAKCAQGSVAGVVSQLWKAGLINKNGGRISLKEL